MKTLALLSLLIPSLAWATGGTPTPPPPAPVSKSVKQSTSVKQTTAVDVKAAAETNVDSRLKAELQSQGGSVTIAGSHGSARAPDILSYPTAPCRIAVGGSAGWVQFGFGLNGSVMDENCEINELRRGFQELGNTAAATQVMCLSEKGRKALEATGTKCLIKSEEPTVQPNVTP